MQNENHKVKRPPVVAIMGHIDHGKSTLLSSIRHSALPSEAGGITQHISAYEAEWKNSEGETSTITFLDTPGHEAFSGHRLRGASAADIIILALAADDGVKPQTIEALNVIKESDKAMIVAFTKIDKPEANLDRAKTTLAESGVYVEGFGGTVSWVGVSGKTGEGVDKLLDTILLTAELEEFTGDPSLPAKGIIIESHRDAKKGITAVAIVKDGTLKKNSFAASRGALAPVRAIEDWKGMMVESAGPSSPVRIFGWNDMPAVGETFQMFTDKTSAEAYAKSSEVRGETSNRGQTVLGLTSNLATFPIVLKADTAGSLEAVVRHVEALRGGPEDDMTRQIIPAIVRSGIGAITENDVRVAAAGVNAPIVGFNVKVDSQAKNLAERDHVSIATFDVIYKLSEWLASELEANAPRIEVEETSGSAKVLKTFSRVKDKQIVGLRSEEGVIKTGEEVRIIRRTNEIARGRIREMQSQKMKISEAEAGTEFGAMIECKTEIVPGDHIRAVTLVRK